MLGSHLSGAVSEPPRRIGKYGGEAAAVRKVLQVARGYRQLLTTNCADVAARFRAFDLFRKR
jgi:hypothetical protein